MSSGCLSLGLLYMRSVCRKCRWCYFSALLLRHKHRKSCCRLAQSEVRHLASNFGSLNAGTVRMILSQSCVYSAACWYLPYLCCCPLDPGYVSLLLIFSLSLYFPHQFLQSIVSLNLDAASPTFHHLEFV